MATKKSEKSQLVGRDDFFARIKDIPYEDVPVPEFGDGMMVRLKAMDALRQMTFGKIIQERGYEYMHAAYVAACAVDENDQPVFTVDDSDHLMALDGRLILRLSKRAQQVCGVSR